MNAIRLGAVIATALLIPISSTFAQGLPTGLPELGRGSYLGGSNGSFLNPIGRPLSINPLVPFNWGLNPPANLNNACFTSRIGGQAVNYWQARSGYFYPWFNGGGLLPYNQNGQSLFFYAPTLFRTSGSTIPVAKLPSPSVQLADFLTYLDACLADKKISQEIYNRIKLRAGDLQRKLRSMMVVAGGELDAQGEGEIRTDIENLTKEMTEHLVK